MGGTCTHDPAKLTDREAALPLGLWPLEYTSSKAGKFFQPPAGPLKRSQLVPPATLGPFPLFVDGAKAMRFVLALGLFMAMCASVDAATVYHSKPRHHASVRHAYGVVPSFVVRPSQAVIPSYVTPGGVRVYRDDSVSGGLRTDHDAPPAYDDPSKFGGA